MKTKKSQPSSAGFTLIELLVVVVIVGVLGSIAAPGWLGLLNRQKVSTVRNELKAVLKDAQTRAQQRSASYSVTIGSTTNGPTAAISPAGSTATAIVLGSNTKNVQLVGSIGSTTSANSITFDYRGGVPIASVPFVIKVTANNNSNTQKCLIVSSLLGSIVDAQGASCNNPNLGI
jgi:prepilin-type N-terminal cleavage/methylation domain-containing protein